MPSPDGPDDAGHAGHAQNTSHSPPYLAVVGVHCRKAGRTLFKDVSFEVARGQIVELRGSNGSGKSTLLRVLAGLTPPSAGLLYWQCSPVQGAPLQGAPLQRGDEAYARQMAYLGHLNALGAELSAAENLRFFQRMHGGVVRDPAEALQAWGLAHAAHQPVRSLSQGQRRRLALARVWSRQCSLWLLDEPCAALDDAGAKLLDARLAEHLAQGGAAIVATHRPLNVPAALLRTFDLDDLSLTPGRAGAAMVACGHVSLAAAC